MKGACDSVFEANFSLCQRHGTEALSTNHFVPFAVATKALLHLRRLLILSRHTCKAIPTIPYTTPPPKMARVSYAAAGLLCLALLAGSAGT
jgi:hypothetical protein